MRDVIIGVLAEWLAKFERQTKADDEYRESDPDPDPETGRFEEHDFGDLWLDRKLMGAAQFIAKVADECRDMELLGIATHVANQMQARFDAEAKAIEESDKSRWEEASEEDRREEGALEACRVFFGSIPASVIDMSSYRRTVEEARPYFSNTRDYLDLLKYTDERKVLKRIKSRIKEMVSRHAYHEGEIPSREWMRDKFDDVLRDSYRRADQYVPTRLKRCAPQSLIPPIGIDEKT